MAVSGVGKLHAVLGGFHLGPAPQDYVDHTVTELERLDPDVVIPMHLQRHQISWGNASADARSPGRRQYW